MLGCSPLGEISVWNGTIECRVVTRMGKRVPRQVLIDLNIVVSLQTVFSNNSVEWKLLCVYSNSTEVGRQWFNNSTLVQIKAWRRSDNKPLSKPMKINICIAWPQIVLNTDSSFVVPVRTRQAYIYGKCTSRYSLYYSNLLWEMYKKQMKISSLDVRGYCSEICNYITWV